MECLGCRLIETAPVTLIGGTVVCSSCPAWRVETEARMVAGMPTLEARRGYLADVEQKRGKVSADELREVIKVEWTNAKKQALNSSAPIVEAALDD